MNLFWTKNAQTWFTDAAEIESADCAAGEEGRQHEVVARADEHRVVCVRVESLKKFVARPSGSKNNELASRMLNTRDCRETE